MNVFSQLINETVVFCTLYDFEKKLFQNTFCVRVLSVTSKLSESLNFFVTYSALKSAEILNYWNTKITIIVAFAMFFDIAVFFEFV